MKHKVGELISIIVVVVILSVTTILIFHFAPWKNNSGKRIIFLTAVAKNGVWTEETVNGSNYWNKDFKQAVIILKKGEEVIFRFTSMDVTHSFYVPELNIGPVDVWPGKVYDVPFKANKTGSFLYYCTKVCGMKHFYMQGKVIILNSDANLTAQQIAKMQNDSILKDKNMMQDTMKIAKTIIEKGKNLFISKNCIACHGNEGIGGVLNANYVLKTVPALNALANKLRIPDKETADTIIKLLEKNVDLEKLNENPPFPTYSRFLAQYNSIRKKILEGASVVQKADSLQTFPPLYMPAWKNYLTDKEINSIIIYLINLNKWEDE